MDATRDYHTKQSNSGGERQIPYDMWILKYDTNEPIYEIETGGRGREGLEFGDQQTQAIIYRMDKQQSTTVYTAQATILHVLDGKEYMYIRK